MDSPDDMTTNEKQLSLRLPVDLVARVDALVPVLSRLPAYRAFRLERSTAFRIALILGLEALEREHTDYNVPLTRTTPAAPAEELAEAPRTPTRKSAAKPARHKPGPKSARAKARKP